MLNSLTKKKILIMGAALSASTLIINFIQKYFGMSFGSDCQFENPPLIDCVSAMLGFYFLISIPIFLFSLITLKLKEEVFLAWRKFSFIYVFVYVFIISIAPWGYDAYISVAKEIMAMIFGGIYILLSLAIIAYKSYLLREK